MALGVFSVAGEALNFGGRRMETIMRVAWLPVALLLIVNMATVFAYLSVSAGALITFADVPTFQRAELLLAAASGDGWSKAPRAMTAVTVVSLGLQAILIASFMAPLIRYAGLGEKPRPGVVRVAFGPDQLRYIIAGAFSFLFVVILILAPIMLTSFFVLQYVVDALSETMAHFPDPDSLHTIELTTAAERLAAQGEKWIYALALPLAAVVPFLLGLWALAYLHFHPRNRASAPAGGNPLLRAGATLFIVASVVAGGYWLFAVSMTQMAEGDDGTVVAALLFTVAGFLFATYFSLRLYAYPGIAVCRKSLGLGGALRVSRGWNIVRILIILTLIAGFLLTVQFLVNAYALGWIRETIRALYSAADVSTRLVNDGVQGDWVRPVFVWTWNSVKILINVFWTFFAYGVAAGLYGRLYRESEETLDSA